MKSLLALLFFAGVSFGQSREAEQSRVYVDAVREINEKHARSPGKGSEGDMAKSLPAAASKALNALLALKTSAELPAALHAASEAALELDRVDDFARIRARLAKDAPGDAAALDTMLSRPRFVLRGADGVDAEGLANFADVLDGVLAAYDEVFGFQEWSKVPGKKLRVRLHIVEKIVDPPHFAPEFPFHSEIDFPVVDAKKLASPSADGKFLFYGLCHELGHVIAMWGDPQHEADHHAWAHYTGVAIVEQLSRKDPAPAWLKDLKDVQWRSLEIERAAAKEIKPSKDTKAGVLALWIALHDRVGPRALGAAINKLDQEDKRLRVNRVRYYEFEALKKALLEVVKEKDKRQAIADLLP